MDLKRIAAGATVAVVLAVGGSVAVATPAHAALRTWYGNYSSESTCWTGVNDKVVQLLRTGQAKSIHRVDCTKKPSGGWSGMVSYNENY
ncbi:hypothetical protein SAMN06295974_1894 [Plantibacter flavus]|uniref:Secreted protein n=1 Tax=Plantibacter flavus TaxID=150123 RepID=A0A3N2BXM1_9MICO|nr:hypothetical protein [Plantibacter flavus]ROR80000.1 hypothetical protein EDD42_0031 [Plantibacter flavus]SMG28384.1 hypothetical protein SAMN06295974_1894 [Plantibacter flavus]